MGKITKIGFCKDCGKPFEKIGKGSGSRKFCEICAVNNNRKRYHRYEKKRSKRSEYIRNRMKIGRANGTVQDRWNERNLGTNIVKKPDEDWSDEEWELYQRQIKKLKRETIGGYQEMK